jgi:hypothetical protein
MFSMRTDTANTSNAMLVIPENAEAAPKSGLVTPSTTWWMRWLKDKTRGVSVNGQKDCAPTGCTIGISSAEKGCIFVQQPAAQIA